MSDLIDRQQAIDDIWTVSPLAHLDREWIDRWLRQLPPANCSEFPNNSDTISRQEAIDICANAIDLWRGQLGEGALIAVRDKIKQLPPAQPEQRWIPWSSGKLPEESGTYTVTAYDGVTKRVTYAKYQKRLKRWELTGARAYWRVLAWMPLPEPYKGGEQDG